MLCMGKKAIGKLFFFPPSQRSVELIRLYDGLRHDCLGGDDIML